MSFGKTRFNFNDGRNAPRGRKWALQESVRGATEVATAGLVVLSLLCAMLFGAIAVASAASAATNPPCTTTSTQTCAVTLHVTSGSWTTQGGTPPTAFPATTPTAGFKGTEGGSGGLSGALTLPTTSAKTTGATTFFSFSEVHPGSALGQVKATGNVTMTDVLTMEVHITKPITIQCFSTPLNVKFQSTAPYNPATGGRVNLVAKTFTIPDFGTQPPSTSCISLAASTLNKRVAGSVGNAITATLHGILVVPSSTTPTRTSVTTLSATPAVGIAGETTTLTATVAPSAATGHAAFFTGTVQLATVSLASGTAQYKTTSLPAGTDHLKAVYSGDGIYKPSTGTLQYVIKAAPSVNINYPPTVVLGATPTKFAGVVSDPVGGPTVPNVRLDFTLYASHTLTTLNSTEINLAVCTAAYTTCTTNILSGVITTPGTHITGFYGGAGGASGFSLSPGTQIPIYFKLSVKSGSKFGRLTLMTTLVKVTSTGSKVLATLARSSSLVNLTLTAPQASTFKGSLVGADSTRGTNQGYGVVPLANLTDRTSNGPKPTGSMTITLTTTVAGKIVQTTLGAFSALTIFDNTTFEPKVRLNSATWPVGISKVTFTYSGDTYYLPSSSSQSTFTIHAVTGTKYVCHTTVFGTALHNAGMIVTGISTVSLPTTAAAGSTIHTEFSTKIAVDKQTFIQSLLPGTVATFTNSFTLSPSGAATTVLPTGSNPVRSLGSATIDPTNHMLYVASSTKVVAAITIITHTIGHRIPVGSTLEDVAFDPSNHLVYVANAGSRSVTMITTLTNAVVGTISVGGLPYSEALNTATHKLYVTDYDTPTIFVITTSSNTIGAPIKAGTKLGHLAVNPSTNVLYVANDVGTASKTSLIAITGKSGTVTATVALSPTRKDETRPTGTVVVDQKTDTVYVASKPYTKVYVVTGGNGTLAKTITVSTASKLAVNASLGIVYVSSGTSVKLFTVKTSSIVGASALQSVSSISVASTGTIYVGGKGVVNILSDAIPPNVVATIATVFSKATVTTTRPLTTSVMFKAAGTVKLSTSPGNTAVTLTKFSLRITSLITITYGCTAISGSAVIGQVNVMAKSKATISSQPQSQTVNMGQTATFTSSATGVPLPTVQWQTSTNGKTWANIPGATSAKTTGTTVSTSYTTPKSTGTDNGTEFRAVFRNTQGTTPSTPATLRVNVPPSVTSSPSNQVVTAGQPVTFTAAGTARPTPTVQWQVSTNGGKTFSNVPGANSTTLSFTATSTQNGNQYRAVFKNELGTVTTTSATLTVTTTSYRLAGSDGSVFSFGNAQFYGSMGGKPLNQPVVAMAATPDGKGYWLVASDGGIFSFGDAQFYGSMGGKPLNEPIVGMTVAPTGKGYWEVASDGGLFAFGSAQFYGSMGGKPLNKPVVAMAAAPTGKGYWEVASDGGLFAFGAAGFHGSTGAMTLNEPIVGMAPTAHGHGYWLVASDGGIFAFGSAPFYGSTGGGPISGSVVSMAATSDGKGYWLAGSNGAVYNFGDAPLAGSAVGLASAPIVGISR
jgi:YVTN family beta-propeller protein